MLPERPSRGCIGEEPCKGNFARAAGGNVAGDARRGLAQILCMFMCSAAAVLRLLDQIRSTSSFRAVFM